MDGSVLDRSPRRYVQHLPLRRDFRSFKLTLVAHVFSSGTANSGYISTGFFGGLTLGRLVFIDLNRRLGERRAVFFYTIAALGLEFVVWFVPSLVGSAVAVSFVGLLLGPFYP